MNNKPINKIIQAIKNFDINALDALLDDEKSYMNVSKSRFLSKLEKRFKMAKQKGCNAFDDVFFGICESCNKGCEGMTFLSDSGFYLDLYIESKDGIGVDDIYVCHQLTNITDLEKLHDLGFSFCLDEEIKFRPSSEYSMVKVQYELLRFELEHLETNIKFDKLVNWYDGFRYLRTFTNDLDPFDCIDYKLFNKALGLTFRMDRIVALKSTAETALEALIDFQVARTERDQLIWFFENRDALYTSKYFSIPEDFSSDSCVTYDPDKLKLRIDMSGYAYVFDYFKKLDGFYEAMMAKYKPLPAHFELSENNEVECSLEGYLKLHNLHLDVIEKYGRNSY